MTPPKTEGRKAPQPEDFDMTRLHLSTPPTPEGDLISRAAAVAEAQKIADEAKSMSGLGQMALGAIAVRNALASLPAPQPQGEGGAEALADGDASRLPWITYNPGDLFRDRVNIICPGADVIIVANIEIHTARLIVAEHNAALRPAAPAPSEPGVDTQYQSQGYSDRRGGPSVGVFSAPVSAGVDLDGLLATWTGLIESAEADFAEDMAEAETTGERPDLWQYKLEVGLDDARDLITFLSALRPPPPASAGEGGGK